MVFLCTKPGSSSQGKKENVSEGLKIEEKKGMETNAFLEKYFRVGAAAEFNFFFLVFLKFEEGYKVTDLKSLCLERKAMDTKNIKLLLAEAFKDFSSVNLVLSFLGVPTDLKIEDFVDKGLGETDTRAYVVNPALLGEGRSEGRSFSVRVIKREKRTILLFEFINKEETFVAAYFGGRFYMVLFNEKKKSYVFFEQVKKNNQRPSGELKREGLEALVKEQLSEESVNDEKK